MPIAIVVTLAGLVLPDSAAAAITTTAACVDGGGVKWTTKVVWGAEYQAGDGTRRVSVDEAGWTTNASGVVPTDSSVATFEGSGRLVQTLTKTNRTANYYGGTVWDRRNPLNPSTAPGQTRITVKVGRDGDGHGDCTVTHRQPGTPAVTPGASGKAMPVGDLPGWRQTFADDFRAGNVARGAWPGVHADKWGAYPEPWRDTSRNGMYSPQRVLSVNDGVMDMYLHSTNGQPYVAAPQPKLNGPNSDPGDGQLYGRYSVRFRADPVAGYKTAWLLWPDSDDWNEGEIDFPEGRLTGEISAFSHEVGPNPARNAFWADTGKTYLDWHTATIEWTSTGVTFWLDEVKLGTATGDGVPKTPMHWVLQTETRSDKPLATAAGHVQVDWVVAYQRT